ncbi:hypothetical protein DER46DRAFT_165872 [Fusarium sp. MPI-SDFR-AT-0072]|nr:hypothetical protein DER46DRAFT_165872 [Fusarium sp. MPI-SDFR-AT-0072]
MIRWCKSCCFYRLWNLLLRETRVDEAIQSLLSVSLMVRDPITDNYQVHRLVQKEFRDWLGPNRRETAFMNASRLPFEAFPKQIHMQTLHPCWPTSKKNIEHVVLSNAAW